MAGTRWGRWCVGVVTTAAVVASAAVTPVLSASARPAPACAVLDDADLAHGAPRQTGEVGLDESEGGLLACYDLPSRPGSTLVVDAVGVVYDHFPAPPAALVLGADGRSACGPRPEPRPFVVVVPCTLVGPPPYRVELRGDERAPTTWALQVLALDGPGSCPLQRATGFGSDDDVFTATAPTDGVACWEVDVRPGVLLTRGPDAPMPFVVDATTAQEVCSFPSPGASLCRVHRATRARVLARISTSTDGRSPLDEATITLPIVDANDTRACRPASVAWDTSPTSSPGDVNRIACRTLPVREGTPILVDSRDRTPGALPYRAVASHLVLDAAGDDACASRAVHGSFGMACTPVGPEPYRVASLPHDTVVPMSAYDVVVRSLRPTQDCPALGYSPFGTEPDRTAAAVGCRRLTVDPTDLGLPTAATIFGSEGIEHCAVPDRECQATLHGPHVAVTHAFATDRPWIRHAADERRGCVRVVPSLVAVTVQEAPHRLNCLEVEVGDDLGFELMHFHRSQGDHGYYDVLDPNGRSLECGVEWPHLGWPGSCTAAAPGAYRIVGPISASPLQRRNVGPFVVYRRSQATRCVDVPVGRSAIQLRAGRAVCLRVAGVRTGVPQVVGVATDRRADRLTLGSLRSTVPGRPSPCIVGFSAQGPDRITCQRDPGTSYGADGDVLVLSDIDLRLTLTRTKQRIVPVHSPAIDGRAAPGRTIRAYAGDWTVHPASYTYRWSVGGRPVRGATAPTYRVRRSDAGRTVRLEVTARRAGYLPGTALSRAVRVARR